jgi:hypothetical protein
MVESRALDWHAPVLSLVRAHKSSDPGKERLAGIIQNSTIAGLKMPRLLKTGVELCHGKGDGIASPFLCEFQRDVDHFMARLFDYAEDWPLPLLTRECVGLSIHHVDDSYLLVRSAATKFTGEQLG